MSPSGGSYESCELTFARRSVSRSMQTASGQATAILGF